MATARQPRERNEEYHSSLTWLPDCISTSCLPWRREKLYNSSRYFIHDWAPSTRLFLARPKEYCLKCENDSKWSMNFYLYIGCNTYNFVSGLYIWYCIVFIAWCCITMHYLLLIGLHFQYFIASRYVALSYMFCRHGVRFSWNDARRTELAGSGHVVIYCFWAL